MKTSIRSALAIAALLMVARPALALDLQSLFGHSEPQNFTLIHVQDLDRLMKNANAHLHIFDVNPVDVRESTGSIPGAILLPSWKYDVAQELPPDKNSKLVFYCRNTHCMASHEAASRALSAGYSDVSVMADGIEGWKNAGMRTNPVN